MPKISSIEFARKAAGYEGDHPQLGEEQYLDDLVKLIQSGGWLLAYAPETDIPTFEHQAVEGKYTEKLNSVGYASIDDTYDITLLFTIEFDGEKDKIRLAELELIKNKTQDRIENLLNCHGRVIRSSTATMNNVYYTIDFTTPEKFMQAIDMLKNQHYLPGIASHEITAIKETFKPEAMAFLKQRLS